MLPSRAGGRICSVLVALVTLVVLFESASAQARLARPGQRDREPWVPRPGGGRRRGDRLGGTVGAGHRFAIVIRSGGAEHVLGKDIGGRLGRRDQARERLPGADGRGLLPLSALARSRREPRPGGHRRVPAVVGATVRGLAPADRRGSTRHDRRDGERWRGGLRGATQHRPRTPGRPARALDAHRSHSTAPPRPHAGRGDARRRGDGWPGDRVHRAAARPRTAHCSLRGVAGELGGGAADARGADLRLGADRRLGPLLRRAHADGQRRLRVPLCRQGHLPRVASELEQLPLAPYDPPADPWAPRTSSGSRRQTRSPPPTAPWQPAGALRSLGIRTPPSTRARTSSCSACSPNRCDFSSQAARAAPGHGSGARACPIVQTGRCQLPPLEREQSQERPVDLHAHAMPQTSIDGAVSSSSGRIGIRTHDPLLPSRCATRLRATPPWS